jgi:para-nitrobenzyl esterase
MRGRKDGWVVVISWRREIIMRLALAGAWLLGMSVAAMGASPLQVKTDKGVVEGLLTADGKVAAYKGIPFAAPPVGELRWQPPQPAAAWKGVREAKEFGAHCIQASTASDMRFRDPGPGEDCLTLNVWVPADAKPGSLPVMVWIFGGGFQGGGTSEWRQDGQFLARRDVVVVSMNYRLGIFGFFAHPGLTAESAHHASGNYGLMDQAAAIAWVARNIGVFGGDAKNITIFGESAGSMSVSAQMASPMANGLIAKAIGESGGALYGAGPATPTREASEQSGAEFGERVLHAATVAELRKVPAEELRWAEMDKGNVAPRFVPNVDGYFLPESVAAIYAAGKQAHVPLLAGWNADESRDGALKPKLPTMESLKALAEKEFGTDADKFLAAYPAMTDDEAVLAAGDFAGDKFIEYSTWRWLEAQVKTGSKPVYRYRMDLGSPGDRYHVASLGAFHSDDIEYVFGALDSRLNTTMRPEDRAVSDQMGAYWTNFAKTGDPNGPGLPQWPVYGSEQWMVMHLDATSTAKPDDHRARYMFLDSVWGKPRN